MGEGDLDIAEGKSNIFGGQCVLMCEVGWMQFHGGEVGEYFVEAGVDKKIEGLNVVGGSYCQFEGLLIHNYIKRYSLSNNYNLKT